MALCSDNVSPIFIDAQALAKTCLQCDLCLACSETTASQLHVALLLLSSFTALPPGTCDCKLNCHSAGMRCQAENGTLLAGHVLALGEEGNKISHP